jgi:hypothetical protein
VGRTAANHEPIHPPQPAESPARSPAKLDGDRCGRCERPLAERTAFALGGVPRCLRCTLRHPPLLRRSLSTALVVGTILTAINQGTVLVSGTLPAALLWKVPLTYAVPFCVATWGALSNNRLQRSRPDRLSG